MQRTKEKTFAGTAEFWSRRSGIALTPEDGREIAHNIGGFFSTLLEWDREAARKSHEQPLDEIRRVP